MTHACDQDVPAKIGESCLCSWTHG